MKNNILNNEIFEAENDLNYSNITKLNKKTFNVLMSALKGKNIGVDLSTEDEVNFILNMLSNSIIGERKMLFVSDKKEICRIGDRVNCFLLNDREYNTKGVINKEWFIEVKGKLNQYVESLSSYPLNYDKSNQEILFLKVFYENSLKINVSEDIFIENKNINNNKSKIEKEVSNYIGMIENIKKEMKISNITQHPWYGSKRFYNPSDKFMIEEKLEKLKLDTQQAKNRITEIDTKYKIINKKDIKEVYDRFEFLYKLLNYTDVEKNIIIEINRENKNNIERVTKKIEINRNNVDNVKEVFNVNELRLSNNFKEKIQRIANDNLIKKLTIKEMLEVQKLLLNVDKTIKSLNEINNIIGLKKQYITESDTLDNIEFINVLISIGNIDYLKYFNENYISEEFEEIYSELIGRKNEFKEIFIKLNQKISMKSILAMNIEDFKEYVEDYKRYNIFYKFTSKRKAYSFIKGNWQETLLLNNKSYILEVLREVISYIEKINKFKDEQRYIMFFGEIFKGVDTDINIIEDLRGWLKAVKSIIPEEVPLMSLNYNKVKEVIEEVVVEDLDLVRDILLNLTFDKSKKISNYNLALKKKIISYIFQSGSLSRAVINLNEMSEDIDIVNKVTKNKNLTIENLDYNFKDYLFILDIEEEIKSIDNFSYLKGIDIFSENLISLNFMFNKIFQTINKNNSFFTGYKNKINYIIKNENLLNIEIIKNSLQDLIKKNENNFNAVRKYFNTSSDSDFLKFSFNIDENNNTLNRLSLNLDSYLNYSKLFEIKNKLINFNLEFLLEKIDKEELLRIDILNIINYKTYEFLSNTVLSKNSIIRNFNAENYLSMIKEYKEMDLIIQDGNKDILCEKLFNKEDIKNENSFNIKSVEEVSKCNDVDILIFMGSEDDFKKIDIKYKSVVFLNCDFRSENLDEYHKDVTELTKQITEIKLSELINSHLCNGFKYVVEGDLSVNGIIYKKNKPVLYIKFDNEKYYDVKYIKDREYDSFENEYKLDVFYLWTPNLYNDFNNEMLKINQKLKKY